MCQRRIGELIGEAMVENHGGEVFRLLCGLTKGEANAIVRGAALGGKNGSNERKNGFLALKLLSKRFNPKTPAKLFKSLMDIMIPGMIKEVMDVPRKIEEWELECARVKEEHGDKEGLTEGMMVAVLISVIPKDMKEMVLQMGRAG